MHRRFVPATVIVLLLLAGVLPAMGQTAIPPDPCKHVTKADVVALDQAFYNNRLGAFQAGGMIFALRRDVVSTDPVKFPTLTPGFVMVRPTKRPRPIVLRVNAGDCLEIAFQNLLNGDTANPNDPAFNGPYIYNHKLFPTTTNAVPGNTTSTPYKPNSNAMLPAYLPVTTTSLADEQSFWDPINVATGQMANPSVSQPATRYAGVHVTGLNAVWAKDGMGNPIAGISADGSWAGANDVFAKNTDKRRSGLVAPGEKITYRLYAPSEGPFLLYSTAATTGEPGAFGGQLSQGLFGTVSVQPAGTEWYRSQVTREDLMAATYRATSGNVTPADGTTTIYGETFPHWTFNGTTVIIMDADGKPAHAGGYIHTLGGQPVINYAAVGPHGPILKMTDAQGNIVHSDLTAIITGPNAGLLPVGAGEERPNKYIYPDSRQPIREFVIHYHDDFVTTQAFPEFSGPLQYTLAAGRDFFAINYGMGGIGAEILANRFGVGPMAGCTTCRFEEFFLSSWTNGDPAQVVDFPANSQVCSDPSEPEHCTMGVGPKATKAYYPDDPSNVYHSYLSDHLKMQIVHAGTNITHIHHLHAQQWLHSPKNENGHYRDSQMISPGATYTMDHVFNGSGNMNKTVGDSIFHCHFYPHFAQGMWSLWRVHDAFEEGTKLNADGSVATGWNRALPDGEIAHGTPTVALVPMPTIAMAPIPARVRLQPVTAVEHGHPVTVGYATEVNPDDQKANMNPGFPFFIAGVAGQRAAHPPMDFAWEEDAAGNPKKDKDGKTVYLDGGLPRSIALFDPSPYEQHTRWDFSRINNTITAVELPQEGTEVEKIAMAAHAIRKHSSFTPSGQPSFFIMNGLLPAPGAPFADPAVDDEGNHVLDRPECKGKPITGPLDPGNDQPCLVRYKAAAIQIDAVVNKKGWHYPQTRLLTLWGDAVDTINNKRPPQPFFFRANSEQVIEFWHTNLVPNYYELDDFQVRTPTDIIGQHIHLVKFDVTSSDGAANGYNYEDGTFSPQEVREVISSINKRNGIFEKLQIGPAGFSVGGGQRLLAPKAIPYFGEGPSKNNHDWLGAQTTIQRWYADPVFSVVKMAAKDNVREHVAAEYARRDDVERPGGKPPIDRTLRTVFTHDHFGPSTHQQAGLYAGLLTEPTDSQWLDAETGALLGSNKDRKPGADGQSPFDGGPTSWQALIVDTAPVGEGTTPKNYREFAIEFQDRQLAYDATSITHPTPYDPLNLAAYTGWSDPTHAIAAPLNPNPPKGNNAPFPFIVTGSFGTGTYSVNYRQEPLPFRLAPFSAAYQKANNVDPNAADLSHVYRSIMRTDAEVNIQPKEGTPINPADANKTFQFPRPFTGAAGTDPYTPLLRAYAGDNVQVRALVGAHMSPLTFSFHGVNWLFEPENEDSGYREAQTMGISDHFEFIFNVPRSAATDHADYFYAPASDTNGLNGGNWGIMRAYNTKQADLQPLPGTTPGQGAVPNCTTWADAPQKTYNVTAVKVSSLARTAGQGPMTVFYNKRGRGGSNQQQLLNPSAIVYLVNGQPPPNNNFEPLVLRANAGDCVTLNLTNTLTSGVGSTSIPKFYSVAFQVTGSQTEVSQAINAFNDLHNYSVWFMTAFNANRWGFQLPDPSSQSISVATKPGSGGNAWTLQQAPAANYTVTFDPSSPTILKVVAGIPISTSAQAGLHPQLVQYDPASSEGMNIGDNPVQTAPAASGSTPGTAKYVWYMGRVQANGNHEPVEFGAVNLMPSDPLKQHPFGLLGGLVVEPQGATWTVDANSNASATVKTPDGKSFREFVALVQDDVAGLTMNGSTAVGPTMIINGQFGTPDPTKTNTVPIWGTGVPHPGFTFPVPNDSKYIVHSGDIVGVTVSGGGRSHGITFLDKNAAMAIFDIVPPSMPFKQQDVARFGANNIGTDANSCPGQTIATFSTKHGVADRSTAVFECTVHGAKMKGTFVFTKPKYDMLIEGIQVGGTTAGGGAHAWTLNGVTQANGSKYAIKPGDKILVAVGSELHGLTFLPPSTCGASDSACTEASVRKVFDIDPLLTQPLMSFTNGVPWINVGSIPGGWGTAGYGAPMVLMMLTVRSDIPASVTEVPFECTIHQGGMLGSFVINQPGNTVSGRTVTISGDFTTGPTWSVSTNPPGGGAPVVTPVTNNSTFKVLPGDTLVFDTVNGKHGVTLFLNETTANRVFEFLPGGQAFQMQPGNVAAPPPPSWGTQAISAPPTTVLANLRVRATVPPELRSIAFECTQHTTGMAGVIAIGDTNASSVPPAAVPSNWTRAINYRSEPFQYRYAAANFQDNFDACTPLSPLGVGRALSNTLVQADPQTPVFVAGAGSPFRIRFLHPAGLNEQTIMLHGHSFQEEPYNFGSTAIANNKTSQVFGARDGFGPSVSFDMVVDAAGGAAHTPGDYVYRTFIGDDFFAGLWGLLRVSEPGKDAVTVTRFPQVGVANVTKPVIGGTVTVNPATGTMADQVEIVAGGTTKRVPIDAGSGMWMLDGVALAPPVKVTSLKCNDTPCTSPQRWGTVTATNYIPLIQQNMPAATPKDLDIGSTVGQYRAIAGPDGTQPIPPTPSPTTGGTPAPTSGGSHDMSDHE